MKISGRKPPGAPPRPPNVLETAGNWRDLTVGQGVFAFPQSTLGLHSVGARNKSSKIPQFPVMGPAKRLYERRGQINPPALLPEEKSPKGKNTTFWDTPGSDDFRLDFASPGKKRAPLGFAAEL